MVPENPPDDLQPDEAQDPKRPYETPHLSVYGDISSVTKAVGMRGKNDGGGMNTRKTQA